MTALLLGVSTDAQEVLQEDASITADSSSSSLTLKDSEKLDLRDHHHHDHGHHNHSHTDDDEAFCRGMYMVMFTDGFRWSLASKTDTNATSAPPCLAYYVASWKLSMSGKFRGAMVFSFLLALLTEGLSVSRFALIQYLHVFTGGNNNNNNNNNRRSRKHKLVLTIVYALQQWLGTMIMLVGMMYSIEMLLSVVAGLCLGNFVFVRDHPDKRQRLGGIGISGGGSLPPSASVDPFQQPGDDNGSGGGVDSNAAATGSASLPGVNRRSNTTVAGCAGEACADIDEERRLLSTPTSMDGTESSLEMPTRKED